MDFRARLLTRLAAAASVTACGAKSGLSVSDRAAAATDAGPFASGGAGGAAGRDAGRGGSGGSTSGGASAGGTGGTSIIVGDSGAGATGGGVADSGLRRERLCVAPQDGGCRAPESLVGARPEPCPDFEVVRVVTEVHAGPESVNGACCYDVTTGPFNCGGYVGRAFLVEEGFVKAVARPGGTWRAGMAPDVAGLSSATRRALAEAWVKDGLFEHASVATFSRFAMQLLALGAPADLVRDTLAAGTDEIRHAELCFALASAYAGEALDPGRFPIAGPVHVETDLARMVIETVVEGCIGETLAAVQAHESLVRATDPAVLAALESTVEDETRHAELAWRVTAWAIATGGERVRRQVALVFANFRPPAPPPEDLAGVDADAFSSHGRLTAAEARAAAMVALRDVVAPCARSMLAGAGPERPTDEFFPRGEGGAGT